MKLLIIVLLMVSAVAFADDKIVDAKKHESVNYCHDKTHEKYLEALMIKYNYDQDVIKLYSLRVGLCKAVDDKKIKLDDAIDVFNAEHLKIAEEWAKEAKKNDAGKKMTI